MKAETLSEYFFANFNSWKNLLGATTRPFSWRITWHFRSSIFLLFIFKYFLWDLSGRKLNRIFILGYLLCDTLKLSPGMCSGLDLLNHEARESKYTCHPSIRFLGLRVSSGAFARYISGAMIHLRMTSWYFVNKGKWFWAMWISGLTSSFRNIGTVAI